MLVNRLAPGHESAPSLFRPEHLLREARRQRRLPLADVPEICALDPDGDIVRRLTKTGAARPSPAWACYHTHLHEVTLPGGIVCGLVGSAVGAPFAVLVAEQLFASGCRFLASVTSAGQIAAGPRVEMLILIERALRDEGTSAHYLPSDAGAWVHAPDRSLLDRIETDARASLPDGLARAFRRGATWTTDAPYRETEAAIAAAQAHGALAVEMEAAALLAFATARQVPIACFAHVTNAMGQHGDDFEKGDADGTVAALALLAAAARAFRTGPATPQDAALHPEGDGRPLHP